MLKIKTNILHFITKNFFYHGNTNLIYKGIYVDSTERKTTEYTWIYQLIKNTQYIFVSLFIINDVL